MLKPEQAREDAIWAREFARHLCENAQEYPPGDFGRIVPEGRALNIRRLAAYAEEYARMTEGITELRDKCLEAAEPTDSPFPAFSGIESASQVYADKLTALLAEGQPDEGGCVVTTTWAIDAGHHERCGMSDAQYPWCQVDEDGSIVVGMTYVKFLPPEGCTDIIVHHDGGQEACDAWVAKHSEFVEALRATLQKRGAR